MFEKAEILLGHKLDFVFLYVFLEIAHTTVMIVFVIEMLVLQALDFLIYKVNQM